MSALPLLKYLVFKQVSLAWKHAVAPGTVIVTPPFVCTARFQPMCRQRVLRGPACCVFPKNQDSQPSQTFCMIYEERTECFGHAFDLLHFSYAFTFGIKFPNFFEARNSKNIFPVACYRDILLDQCLAGSPNLTLYP